MTIPAPASFTQLLTDWRSGNPQALNKLAPLVYDELRRLARNHMRAERGSHTLQATAVVHEAFLRLIQANVVLQDRGHFFALASRLMRRVLVDHARSRSRIKRNSGAHDLPAEDAAGVSQPMDFDVVAQARLQAGDTVPLRAEEFFAHVGRYFKANPTAPGATR